VDGRTYGRTDGRTGGHFFPLILLGRLFEVDLINGNGGCRLWQPVQADSQPKSSGLVLRWRPLGAILHSSNELGELS